MKPFPFRFPRSTRSDKDRLRDALAELGAMIAAERIVRRYSRQSVADVAGIHVSQFINMECGRFGKMTVLTLLTIIDRCGLRVQLVPRDQAEVTYRAERDAAEQRRAERSQRDLFAEAKEQYDRETRREVKAS